VEGIESKTGSPVSSNLAKFGPPRGKQGFRIKALLSAGAKGPRSQ
jgi:hypothetical protein